LAGKYTASQHSLLTGLLQSTVYSGDGGLPGEAVGYGYDLQGLLSSIGGDNINTPYLGDTYTPRARSR
jgi:hypothetical protein